MQLTKIKTKWVARDKIEVEYKDCIKIYTDGSILTQEGERGNGIVFDNSNQRKISIKETEVIAIWMAMKKNNQDKTKIDCNFHGLSSVKSLDSHIKGINNGYYEEQIIRLAKENPSYKINIILTRAHCGI